MTAISSINDIKSINNSALSQTPKDGLGIADTFDDFLLLLTTQLENQDPTEPLDANQFTQQLVDFAGVEQNVNTNTHLKTLIDVTKGSQSNNAVISSTALIGKTIEAEGNTLELVNGAASFSYTLPDDTATSFITIKDTSGRIVRSFAGESEAGDHQFIWNGRDNTERKLPDGQYIIEISGFNQQQSQLEVSTRVRGVVTAVVSGEDTALVVVGDSQIPVNNITGVIEEPVVTAQQSNSNTDSEDTTSSEDNSNNEEDN